ncbi:MAG: hypothetical protein Q9167_000024 [Letrouitia subvulpina]
MGRRKKGAGRVTTRLSFHEGAKVTFVSAEDSTPEFRERESLSKLPRNNNNQDSLEIPVPSISLSEQSSDDSLLRSSVAMSVRETIDDAPKQTKNLLSKAPAGEDVSQSIRYSRPRPHCLPQTSPNSSEEEIVFRGRNDSKRVGSHKRPVASQNGSLKLLGSFHKPRPEKEHAKTIKNLTIDDLGAIDGGNLEIFALADCGQLQLQEFELPQASASVFDESEIDVGPRKYERSDRHEDEILADYIANVRASGEFFLGEDTLAFDGSPRIGLATLNQSKKDAVDSSDMHTGKLNFKARETEWNPTSLHKYDNVNTAKDVLKKADGELFQRSIDSTKEYSNPENTEGTDQSYGMPPTSFPKFRRAANNLLSLSKSLEAVHILDAESLQVNDDVGGPHGGSIFNQEKRKTNPSDTKAAEFFTELKGLDLGSDQSFVLDGLDFDEEGESTDDWNEDELGQFHLMGKQAKLQFPKRRAPSNLANWDENQHQGLDTLHEGQPSRGKKSLKRRATHSFGSLDTELEALLQSAWEKDRAKKSVRKQERELRRAHGLLGKKRKGQSEPEDQYPPGLSIQQITDTFNGFLGSSVTSLTLQPMRPLERKVIHEFAHALNIKSRSKGSKTSRFPVLFKTSETIDFDEEALEMIYRRLRRRWRPQLESIERHRQRNYEPRPRKAYRRSGGGDGGVRCRDGEIVGGAAPEIGQENKGRAMLERMGWSTGTALGALNNKGMLQPVTHVVKTSRAGLG